MKRSVLPLRGVGWLLLVILGAFCGSPTAEDLIFEQIEDLGREVEAGDLPAVMTYISLEYSDDRGRTHGDIEDLIEGYIDRHQGIVIHILEGEVQNLQPAAADLQVDISVSSGYARALRKVISISGYLVRLSLKLEKTLGIWQVKSADWRVISRDELFPGSRALLRELFPALK